MLLTSNPGHRCEKQRQRSCISNTGIGKWYGHGWLLSGSNKESKLLTKFLAAIFRKSCFDSEFKASFLISDVGTGWSKLWRLSLGVTEETMKMKAIESLDVDIDSDLCKFIILQLFSFSFFNSLLTFHFFYLLFLFIIHLVDCRVLFAVFSWLIWLCGFCRRFGGSLAYFGVQLTCALNKCYTYN